MCVMRVIFCHRYVSQLSYTCNRERIIQELLEREREVGTKPVNKYVGQSERQENWMMMRRGERGNQISHLEGGG